MLIKVTLTTKSKPVQFYDNTLFIDEYSIMNQTIKLIPLQYTYALIV